MPNITMPNRKINILILEREKQNRNAYLSKHISHWYNFITTSILIPLVASTSKYNAIQVKVWVLLVYSSACY